MWESYKEDNVMFELLYDKILFTSHRPLSIWRLRTGHITLTPVLSETDTDLCMDEFDIYGEDRQLKGVECKCLG